MQEVLVLRADLDETLKRLAREGNQVRSVADAPSDEVGRPVGGEVIVRFERRTEIREDV